MKRFFAVFSALTVALIAVPCNASVWTDALSYDGIVDLIQDNSVSFAIFENGDDKISAGDIVAGTVKWNINIADGTPVADHAISVFAVEVLSDNGFSTNTFGGNKLINFSVGPSAASVAFLTAALPIVAGTIGGFDASAIGVTLSHVGGVDVQTLPLAAALALVDATYDPDFEFGMVGTDYFEAELRDHRKDFAAWTGTAAGLAGLAGDAIISLKDTDGDGFIDEYDDSAAAGPGFLFPAGTTTGFESAGFSILKDITGPGTYLPVETIKLDGSAGPLADISLLPSTTLAQPTAAEVANGYAFADQSLIAINGVPEPASMAVWGGLMLIGGVAGYRRRKVAKAKA